MISKHSRLLHVRDLRTTVAVDGEPYEVVRGVTFTLDRGEILGLVGESGSGKSMTARSIVRLLPPGATVRGEVLLDGEDVLSFSRRELRRARASRMAMIFQDPRAAINPVRTCGSQLREVLQVNRGLRGADLEQQATELLELVRIQDPGRILSAYPSELSGGMLQRILIAMVLAVSSQLLIADEATTALDATVQADILGIFARSLRARDTGMLFITHDLELAAAICDRVIVMYAGSIIEEQQTSALFRSARHPYTTALLAARPDIRTRQHRLAAIPGRPPTFGALPSGCAFHPRCHAAIDRCVAEIPVAHHVGEDAFAVCHRADEPLMNPLPRVPAGHD